MMGHYLDVAMVFTCLALFNNLISPLNSFPWVINGLIDAFMSTRRLSLSCFEYKHERQWATNSPTCFSNDVSDFNSKDMAVIMQDATCSWYSGNEEDQIWC